ncbi:MAG TPA: LPS export ABC transporter permease LptG, partial [Burkholderiaceae bacterium]|nr:LPS export ABC transporter permease LptG [Burkholderiaceae bacterium]
LLAFFDLMTELKSVGQGDYRLPHAFMYVGLGIPNYINQFMPIAVLIGTILTLVQFAARSEFTIMRASSMSTVMIGWTLIKIGVVYVLITFLFGEVIAPVTSEMADRLRAEKLGASGSQEFRSGQWTKDLIRSKGVDGTVIGSRILNVRDVRHGELKGIVAYEFDRDFHLLTLTTAARAEYQGGNVWRLIDVTETRFANAVLDATVSSQDIAAATTNIHLASKDLVSELTPKILRVSASDPDNMTAYSLALYSAHLAENSQSTALYDIAFWKKIINPFANLVMMALALPFAYLHTRAGGTSLKAFIGIMIGVSFVLIKNLFSFMGLLATWPPFFIAILPSALYLLAAGVMLRWAERH